MKCIIYGLGSGRVRVEKYLKSEHEIVGYSDSFYKEAKFNDKKFYKPQELFDKQFDFIIIAIGEEEIREKIYSSLIDYKVDKNKIIDFYYIYCLRYIKDLNIPLKKVDRVVNKNYDGIILGISHAEAGINHKYLDGEFCNLAIGSQDLFYNLRTLQILIEKYNDKIKKLQYAIIDMHKYTYFNYDVSLSKGANLYYKWSGFRSDDCHNFKHNKNYNKSIEEEVIDLELKEERKVDNRLMSLFDGLFKTDNIDIVEDYKETGANNNLFEDFPRESYRNRCITIEDIEEYKNTCKASAIQMNRFEKTIKENIEIFDELMRTLRSINSKIKIYILLIPQHKVVEDFEKDIEENFKIEFYNILKKFNKKYDFNILDFKNNEEISSRNDYYYDMQHLNYHGATVFTKLLNSYILLK